MGADIKESRDLRARATGLKLASDASQRHITETLAEVRFLLLYASLPPHLSLSLSRLLSLSHSLSLSLPLPLPLSLSSPTLSYPLPLSIYLSLSPPSLILFVCCKLFLPVCIVSTVCRIGPLSSSALLEPTLLLRIVLLCI